MNDFYHKTVLLQETIEFLSVKKSAKYIDATLGGGGLAQKILNQGGIVLGIDVDEDALSFVKENLRSEIEESKLILAHGNFKNIDEIAKEKGFKDVDGIVFDLGVSSHQIDDSSRGFSYQREGPLDMRMDQDLNIKASDLLNVLTKGELYDLFIRLGQESRSRAISDAIVRARRVKLFENISDLTNLIENIYGFSGNVNMKQKALANRKVFQALRMAVNQEISALADALPKAITILKEGGRLCVISFHSLEDRVVKNSFKEFEEKGFGIIITKKPIVPAFNEISENKRSASAKMRVFEKI